MGTLPFALYFFGNFIFMIIFFMIKQINGGPGFDAEEAGAQSFLAINCVYNLLALIVIYQVLRKRKDKRLHMRISGSRKAALSLLGAFLYSLGFSMLAPVLGVGQADDIAVSMNYFNALSSRSGTALKFLLLIILQPFVEELLMRKFLHDRLKNSFSNRAAIIVAGFIFGLMHLAYPVIALFAVGMGIILGLIYEKNRSLLMAIIAHSLGNMADYIAPEIGSNRLLAGALILISLVPLYFLTKETAERRI